MFARSMGIDMPMLRVVKPGEQGPKGGEEGLLHNFVYLAIGFFVYGLVLWLGWEFVARELWPDLPQLNALQTGLLYAIYCMILPNAKPNHQITINTTRE